jgi:hypothetical protein
MPRFPYLIATVFLLVLVGAKYDPATGFTSLLRVGETWAERRTTTAKRVPTAIAQNSNGYDGQFYSQIALDPTLRDSDFDVALDAPAYRSRRILAPALAYVLGLGRPNWVIQVYALLNVGCWLILAVLVHRELPSGDAAIQFARWFGCMFSLGALDSIRQSLVDLPALLLVVVAIRAQRRAATGLGGLASTLAHLSKETAALATIALAVRRPTSWRDIAYLVASFVPLALWIAYVAQRFPNPSESGAGNFMWPFMGALELLSASLTAIASGDYDGRHTFGILAVVSLFFQAGFLALNRAPSSPWWRIGVSYALLLTILGTWVWSGYWAACRTLLPLTFAFNVTLAPGRCFWPCWALGNVTLLHGIWRFL